VVDPVPSPPRLRAARPGDLGAVHALNQAAVPHVNSLTPEALAELIGQSRFCRVAEVGGAIAAFLLALGPEADYASPNFLWFRERYPRFAYVDRVVVAEQARGRGLGRLLYEALETFARRRAPRLTCEVNLHPPNPGSLAFHRRLGFRQVGIQDTEGGTKTVALLVKELRASPVARRG
jgi:predicted GNAT superfamily acetyltransferase